MESLKGSLLIAGGGLLDLNFRQTVVLIAAHGEDGALGVVLNRPAGTTVGEAAPELAAIPGVDERLFVGGPVAPENAVVLARFVDPAESDALVFGSVGIYSAAPPGAPHGPEVLQARVFAGYAGWGPGQLESELAASAWLVEPATEADVFSDEPEELWRSVLRRKGPAYELLTLMPFDPSMN